MARRWWNPRTWFASAKTAPSTTPIAEGVLGGTLLGPQVDPDDSQYRSIGGRSVAKAELDLSPYEWERQLHDCYVAWFRNGLARRYISILTDFTFGEGVTFAAEDERIQDVIDHHWSDPANLWGRKAKQRIQDLAITGELILLAFANEHSGRVRFGVLWPSFVERIETDPGNSERVVALVLKDAVSVEETYGAHVPRTAKLPKRIAVLQPDPNPASPTYGIVTPVDHPDLPGLAGALYFPINVTSASARGHSDLLTSLDWVQDLDRIMFDRIEKILEVGSYIWDVTFEDASQADIDEWGRKPENRKPRSGEVRGHNSKVKWEAVAPDLKATDADVDITAVKRHIFSMWGVPETWMSDAGNTNRAGSLEAGVPTFKMLRSRQVTVRHVFEMIGRVVVDFARAVRPDLRYDDATGEAIDDSFGVELSRVENRDAANNVTTLATFTATLASARDSGFVSHRRAVHMWASLASEIGFEVDAEAELEAVGGEDAWDMAPGLAGGQTDEVDEAAEPPPSPVDVRRHAATAADVAENYKTSPSNVISWAKRGDESCPHLRLGKRYRFNLEDVHEWVLAQAKDDVAEAVKLVESHRQARSEAESATEALLDRLAQAEDEAREVAA